MSKPGPLSAWYSRRIASSKVRARTMVRYSPSLVAASGGATTDGP